jgi:hypothetical protein
VDQGAGARVLSASAGSAPKLKQLPKVGAERRHDGVSAEIETKHLKTPIHNGPVSRPKRRHVMKTTRWLLMLTLLSLILSSCVEVGYWLDLVGRWQDVEAPSMELQFTKSGRFTEYMFGQVTGTGSFEAHGKQILLVYDNCNPSTSTTLCSVRLGFDVVNDTLVITDSVGDIVYRRVDAGP